MTIQRYHVEDQEILSLYRTKLLKVPPKKSAGASSKSKKAGTSLDKENPKNSKDKVPENSKVLACF